MAASPFGKRDSGTPRTTMALASPPSSNAMSWPSARVTRTVGVPPL